MKRMFKGLALGLLVVMLFQVFLFVPVNATNLQGDLNSDGSVDSIDYVILKRIILGISENVPANILQYGDLFKDGTINSSDCSIMKRYILGIVDTLPYIPNPTPTPTNTPTPTASATPFTTPQKDWISYVPQPEDVALNLVINYGSSRAVPEVYVNAVITFPDEGYRIVEEGTVNCARALKGVSNYFSNEGLIIEKYVGSAKVNDTLTRKQIKYYLEQPLAESNCFTFRTDGVDVTNFWFTPNSVIAPTPVPYSAQLNSDFVKGNTKFAADLMQKFSETEDIDKNIFFSPFSISTALSMAYQGANTTTKECIEKTLNYTGMSTNEINRNYKEHLKYFKSLYPQVELNIANSIWSREGLSIKDSFLTTNEDIFGAKCTSLDFSDPLSVDIINKWISNSTKGMIGKMVNPPIPQETMMYLVNAIYFKGNWTDQFDISATKEGSFKNIKGEIKSAMMMSKFDSYNYTENDAYRAVELPYGSGNVSMYCILPQKGNVNDFISGFNYDKWEEIKSKLKYKAKINLKLPRFKIDYEPKKLNDHLKALGLEEAYSKNADFLGISNEKLWIDSVSHKAIIDVNEKGTEAAAVTVIGISGTSMPNSFIADQPFMFLIADNKTGTILFMGKVVDL